MALKTREVTADGLEAQIGTNHFGHFLLSALLFPKIAKGGRIINHSSGAHKFAAHQFVTNDLLSEKSYSPWYVCIVCVCVCVVCVLCVCACVRVSEC
jgi:NAD(P)-dependent dehydrogenase (short-subunit alcohol dehydrogenase family)